jgi:DNA (cytosine-5)-methyltransferase 1
LKELKFIDLFAGAGGLRIPFDELGLKAVFSSEIDKFAQKTYYSYFGEMPYGDITKIEPEDIPDHDILLAGFPCQPFSQAGKKEGFADTRGTLFFNIEEILRVKRPRAFLLENVKGLRGHDKGKTFKVISENLAKLGYHFKDEVLKAKDFGLPQNRERVFIVGFLDFEKNFKFEFPRALNLETKLGDILEKVPDEKYTISDKLWAGHQRRKAMHKIKGNGFGYGLFNEESEYTNTISARYYKDGSEILIEQKGKNPRKLTPFEASQLQGFPKYFIEKAKQNGLSDVQLYKQMGNSVPVSVIREIAKNIVGILNGLDLNN